MSSFTVLITGANRGIGLGLVKQFLSLKEVTQLFAASRSPQDAKVDAAVGAAGLNLLINNAGILPHTPFDQPNRPLVANVLEINTISPLVIAQVRKRIALQPQFKTFLPLLRRAAALHSSRPLGIRRAAIINISSGLGSIGENSTGSEVIKGSGHHCLAYRASKAALNAISKSLSIDLKNDGILVLSQCPGWVQTDMGGKNASLTLEQSTSALLKNFLHYDEADNGFFYKQTGDRYLF